VTSVQAEAIKRAEDSMRPAMILYELRNYITFRVGMLGLMDLKRLSNSLKVLDDSTFGQVIDYIEGLAMWQDEAPSSDGVQETQETHSSTAG